MAESQMTPNLMAQMEYERGLRDGARALEPTELARKAEDRWTTVRHLVWQGWSDNIDPSRRGELGDAGRYYVDDDGGLWLEAHPEVCEEAGHHFPRWHPAEIGGHFYCTRCGAQGVPG